MAFAAYTNQKLGVHNHNQTHNQTGTRWYHSWLEVSGASFITNYVPFRFLLQRIYSCLHNSMAWPEIISVKDHFHSYGTDIWQNQQNNCVLKNFAYHVLEFIRPTQRCSLAELRIGKLKICLFGHFRTYSVIY